MAMSPEDCSKQWEILLLLIASEEKKNRTKDNEVTTMNYYLRNEAVKQILLQWLRQMKATYAIKISVNDTALKCDDVSQWWRQKGNEKFRNDMIIESYKLYTKSILFAHQNGPKYPLALANRSASLLKMKKYKECLSDIELALAAGYPNDMRYKLLLRRAECLIEINKQDAALEALAQTTLQAGQLNFTQAQMADLNRHIKSLERKITSIQAMEPSPEADVIPGCHRGENQNFKNASNAVEIRRNEQAGRHVVAREAMRRGDIVFSEAPYAWVALPSEVAVCDWCCTPHINPIPCSTCSRVLYCNPECRTRAACYHRWECVGAQCEIFRTIGIGHLALRVLIISTISGFPAIPAACHVPGCAADLFRSYSTVDNIDIYKSDTPAFYRMFNLVTNFNRMNNVDYIQYALTATMLTLYLEHFTNFFEHMSASVPYALSNMQLRIFAGAVILRALGQLVSNGHAALTLSAVDEGAGATVFEREVRRATAIYPSAAMMNHSCDPNIINTFYKTRLIVRCGREVAGGAQIFNCYGPHRARETSNTRKQLLREQYFFSCACTACRDDERKDSVLLFSAYACASCRSPILRAPQPSACPHCRLPFTPRRATDVLDQAEGLLSIAERATSFEERLDNALTAYRLKQLVLYRHNTSIRETADYLARIYADHGDFTKSVELIKQNIQSLEYQFGSFSVEVAHELRKLSDVMLERIARSPQNNDYKEWCLEAHKVIKKAVLLMELNYGSWEAVVKRLKELEKLVAALVAECRSPDAADNIHQLLHYNLKI